MQKKQEPKNLYGAPKGFEGEYLNGERNGIGKEYSKKYKNYGKLIFEGEYLNGKRNGKGKEYEYDYFNKKYIITFEGEYSNGERNGNGKDYSYDKYNERKKINIFWKGANSSKSSYKIEEIQETFSEDFDFFQNEKNKI